MKTNLKKTVLWIVAGIFLVAAVHWAAAQFQYRRDIIWTTRTDEYRLVCRGIYNSALEELEEITADLRRPWAVVLDVDDTLLSSAEYRIALKRRRTIFYRPRWRDWCRRGDDPAVPGGAGFTRKARELGGKVVLITNRQEELRAPTEKNLQLRNIEYDALLMSGPDTSKTIWREKVEKGTAVPDLGPLKIVMLIGDKVTDFPHGSDAKQFARKWGQKYFIIPNPMRP
ncbi:MAG: HAD family acid phosphatase [Candidatus Erginobacter occultus]|nr:HAD family acid phosphatase [Candidatus Erginobacter occultus]